MASVNCKQSFTQFGMRSHRIENKSTNTTQGNTPLKVCVACCARCNTREAVSLPAVGAQSGMAAWELVHCERSVTW